MEKQKLIYCIEGVHDWDAEEVEPTVEPMLELLQKLGYWDHYIYRTCGTKVELEYRLRSEWNTCREKGSVLFFSTHGDCEEIWLRKSKEHMSVTKIKDWLNCDGCHIHFGGCYTFAGEHESLKELGNCTGAVSISGYSTEEGWLESSAPALALELLFFGLMAQVDLARDIESRPKELAKIRKEMRKRFEDCEFGMIIKKLK